MARFRFSKRWRRILLFTWMFPKPQIKTVDDRTFTPVHLLEDGAVPLSTKTPSTTDALCSRCTTIPWSRLLEAHDRGPILVLQNVHESKEELRRSNCRVCRMLGSIKRFDEDSYLKWIVPENQKHFVGKLTFAQEPSISNHDAELTSPYLGITHSSLLDRDLTVPFKARIDPGVFKKWLESCATHEECIPDEQDGVERLKVIDCETRTVSTAPGKCRFVALSYLWGSLEDNAYGPLPAEQPPTIEDAITVTLSLGLRYIWIDRYCIDQMSAMDKYLQIKQMGQIYASAFLTIIAAAGTNPNYGLPGVREPRSISESSMEKVGPVALIQLKTSVASDLQHSMWATRAWTFQEGILSKRRLIFTEKATLYICNTDYQHDLASEYNSGLNYELLALAEFISCARLPREIQSSIGTSRFKEALRYLTAYSRRNLRDPKHALNAIVGILNYISNDKTDPAYHLWGVPLASVSIGASQFDTVMKAVGESSYVPTPKEELFEFALNWVHTNPCNRRNGFPSWSPLGWDGPIEYPRRYVDVFVNRSDVRLGNSYATSGASDVHHELKPGYELQYEGKNAVPMGLEIVAAPVAPLQVIFEEDKMIVKLEDGTALDSDFETYWDMKTGKEDGEHSDREESWIAWRIGCKAQKRRCHYMILRSCQRGVYERGGLIVAGKGTSNAGLLGASFIDPIPMARFDNFVVI